MKIAFWHFYTFRLLRGIETLALSLGNALALQGVDVTHITAKPQIRPLIQPAPGVKVYSFPAPRYYSHQIIAPFYLGHFLRHHYDRVVVFFADFGEGLAYRALKAVGQSLPIDLYLCYPASTVPHRYQSFMRLGWHQTARWVLADAAWIAREAEELFGRSVAVLTPGTDSQRFLSDMELRAIARAELGLSPEDVVLLNVSALEPQKGTWRGLQSFARLANHLPHLRYVILGKGKDEARLQQMVRDLGVQEKVFFSGVSPNLERYYNLADVFVMLPDMETYSVACFEAMSSGLPVLVSNTGGFPEGVPTEAGFLVSPDDPDGIDAALNSLIVNPQLRAVMGEAGRAHVLAHHTWEQAAKRYLEIVG